MKNKMRDNLFLSVVLIILIIFILSVSFVTFGIDFNNVIIPTLGITIFLTIYNKTVAGVIKKKECLQDKNIKYLESKILENKDEVYDNGKVIDFDTTLEYRNKKKLLYKLRKKLDVKLDKCKNDIERDKILPERDLLTSLIKLLENKQFKEYDELENNRKTLKIIRINSIKYRKLKRVTLFNNISKNANDIHQMERIGFNADTRSFVHTLLTIIPSKIFVIFISILTIQSNASFLEAVIQLLMYSITSIFSFYMGLKNMEKQIMVGYQKDLELRYGIIVECVDNIEYLK